MEKDRLAAFSDGVIAVIITIMVLELHAPHEASLAAIAGIAPAFLTYALSFIYVAIYWNNHHHLFQLVEVVDGLVLWANMKLLFWLSMIPFATAWMGENYTKAVPTAVYGVALLMPALAWLALQWTIVRLQGRSGPLALALGRDIKGKLSGGLYLAGVILAFVSTAASDAIYAIVALVWVVPDLRIEKVLRRG
jgi:uncharacterized membrane protein